MRIKIILLLGCFFVFFFGQSQNHIKKRDSLQILKVLSAQQEAWNTADIPTFMEGYWQSDKLVFSGAGGPIYGWDATKKRYEINYPNAEIMGTLAFTVLDMIQVDTKSVQMQGRYDLKRTVGDNYGYFTLLWKKIKGTWLIISDHTSAGK